MTVFLYYSISSDLTEDEIIEIDKQVSKNREAFYLFFTELPLNSKRKAKRLGLYMVFLFAMAQPLAPCAFAVMMPLPPAIHRLLPIEESRIGTNKNYPQIAVIPASKVDKVVLTNSQIKEVDIIFDKYLNGSLNLEETILELRAGGFYDWATLAFIIFMFSLHQGDSFQSIRLPHIDPMGWLSGKYDSKNIGPSRLPTKLQMEKPSLMPHEEFVGLTKEERRALPNNNDMKIIHEGRPELEVGFWQSKFKVGDHGAIHDLPYTIKNNDGTKTEKTDDNALKMMRSIVGMPNRDNVEWFENGTYQGGTDREFEAIHIYDLDKKVIAVFQKSTGKFVTTCQLDRDEHDELLETGNFGGGKGWFSGRVKNLPPQQTAVNTFESDVTGITPISPMDKNSSPNPGFTPTSSFESDIMGITPIDNSQLDNS